MAEDRGRRMLCIRHALHPARVVRAIRAEIGL